MTDLYLRSGIFLAPFHNHDENPTLSIERDLELVEHLDRLNYHEAWIGEHHSGGFELIACPEMFIAAAAQRTRHIRLGTGVVSLPYHNPFMVADRMVQLDHMTRGRAMFGMGPGALVHDALKIGIDPGDQRQMMNEALDVIVPLLRGEIVNRKTDWFNLTRARQWPHPRSPRLACRRLFPHRRNARAGDQQCPVRRPGFRRLFPRRRDLPDHPARCGEPGRMADRDRHCLHWNPG
jgi:luciferase-like monooxygenase